MADLLDEWGFRAAPSRRRPTRRGSLWLAGAIGVVVAAAAVVMIVLGLRGPQAAPLPAADFSVAAAEVPDPVTGPLPAAVAGGEAAPQPQPTDQPVAAAGPGRGQVAGAAGATSSSSAGPDTTYAGPTIPDQSQPRPQVPAGALADDHLVVPAVGIDAAVQSTGLVDGQLAISDDVADVTEWDGSAPIDSATGTVLVAGHIDNVHQGPGAMYPLHLLRPGDAVYLTRSGVVTRWKVVSLRGVAKADLPAALFAGTTGPRQLALVTCGGSIAHGSYDDNVIAVATPF